MTTILVETLDGIRAYIQEGDTLVIENGHTLTYAELNALIVDGTLAAYGLKGASPIKSGGGRRRTKTQSRLPLLAATFMKG